MPEIASCSKNPSVVAASVSAVSGSQSSADFSRIFLFPLCPTWVSLASAQVCLQEPLSLSFLGFRWLGEGGQLGPRGASERSLSLHTCKSFPRGVLRLQRVALLHELPWEKGVTPEARPPQGEPGLGPPPA